MVGTSGSMVERFDEGTAMEDANTFDAEDAAVLFELERLRGERQQAVAQEAGEGEGEAKEELHRAGI